MRANKALLAAAWALAAVGIAALPALAVEAPAAAASVTATDNDPMPAAAEAARLFSAGRYAEATPHAEHALAAAQRTLAADDPLLAEFYTLLGNVQRAAGRFDAAEPLLERALALRERALGPQAPETAVSLNNLSALYLSRGDARRAHPLLVRALAIREQVYGPDAPQVATGLTNLGSALDELGRAPEALPLHERALAICERAYGPTDPRTATALNNLAETTGALGRYAEALPLHRRALAIREKALGAEHPDTAVSVGNLAELLESLGRLDEALLLKQRAWANNEAALGPLHPATAVSLGNLAYALAGLGRLDEALAAAQRALVVSTQALGPQAPAVATSLLRLAYVHQQRGEYAQALPLAQRALQMREAERGPQHPDTALALNNVAELHSAMGEYGQAMALHRRALQIREATLGPMHPDTASGLNNLATLHQALGQFDLAEPLLRRALAIHEQVYGPEHAETALSLNNLGQLYVARGQPALGLPLAQRALAIQELRLGPGHPAVAVTLNNLAGMLEDLQRAPEALPLHLRALAIREQALGPRHPAVAASLNNLAALYDTLGEPKRSLPLYTRALAILQPAAGAGTQPVWLAAVHTRLGRWHQGQGHDELAIFHLKQAVNITQGLRAGASTLDTAAQASLARGVESRYRRLAELLVRQGRLPEAEQVLTLLKLQERKDFVRGDAQDDATAALAALSPAERELAESLGANARQLARAYAELDVLDRAADTGAAAQRQRAQLVERIQLDNEALDTLLGDAVGALARGRAAFSAFEAAVSERDAISNRLAVLNERSGGRAAALYIVPGEKSTTFLVVSAQGAVGLSGGVGEAQLNRLAAQLRQAIETRSADYKVAAAELHAALIAPVAAVLATARVDTLMLYLVGALRYVPVAALYDAKAGRHLVEQYALAVYTVGGLRDALAEPPTVHWVAAGLGVSRALAGFDALPAVPGELQAVVRSAQDSAPTGVLAGTRFLDEAFTRERLSQLARRGAPFAVLHVATHFRLVPGREDESQLLLGDGDLLSMRQLRADATLAFGTYDLVTLSACNTSTGGGERAGAEFEGLATTLMKKGARAVMATLWEVQDAGTARLMRAFYAARGEQRQRSKAEALRQAQLSLLTGAVRDESGKLDFRHPYYWAPFILMGNWL